MDEPGNASVGAAERRKEIDLLRAIWQLEQVEELTAVHQRAYNAERGVRVG
jgi:hypothetical protein